MVQTPSTNLHPGPNKTPWPHPTLFPRWTGSTRQVLGLPWWSSGLSFLCRELGSQSLVREVPHAAQCSQKKKKKVHPHPCLLTSPPWMLTEHLRPNSAKLGPHTPTAPRSSPSQQFDSSTCSGLNLKSSIMPSCCHTPHFQFFLQKLPSLSIICVPNPATFDNLYNHHPGPGRCLPTHFPAQPLILLFTLSWATRLDAVKTSGRFPTPKISQSFPTTLPFDSTPATLAFLLFCKTSGKWRTTSGPLHSLCSLP